MISRKPLYKEMSHEILARQMIDEFHEGQFSVAEITNLLIKAKDAYYNYGISIMPDHVFDTLEKVLKQIVPDSDYFKKVGIEVQVTEWKKVAHKISMKSLNKVNSVEEFKKWAFECETDDLIIMEKLDGCSIDLEYENGKLVDAITRGDGQIGDSIFENVKKMKNVKLCLNNFTGSIRGEIIFISNDFEIVNNLLFNEGNKNLVNMRNGATGLSKRLDGKYSKYLSIQFYDCSLNFKTEEEKLFFLQNELKLETCFWKKCNSKQIIQIFEDYEKKIRINLDHEIDGMVIRVNDINLQEKLGLLGSNARGQIAWKFQPMTGKTKLFDVEWTLGSSRRLTPIGILEPIKLGGVTIKHVSLHNLDNFNLLHLYKNCTVLIKRANDVIPYLIGIEND